MRSTTSQSGLSMIELMIGVAILGILTSVAVPSFQTWMRNSQVRNAAESISNGLQKARAEAVSRNTRVAFILENDSSWTVTVVDPALSAASSVIETRSSSEGSKNVTKSVLPLNATTITYNNFGGLTANSGATAALTEINLTAPSASRNLRITIGVGGNARMCDPSATTGTPTAC